MNPNKLLDRAIDEVVAAGHTLDRTAAAALWEKAEVLATRGRQPSERTLSAQKKLSPEMYAEARKHKAHLSDILEEEDPTEPGSRDEMLGIDAFQRQVAALTVGEQPIRCDSSPLDGVPAHSLGDFLAAGPKVGNVTAGQVLLPELGRRAFVEGNVYGTQRFNLFYSSASPLWEGLNPQYLASPMATPRLRQPILNQMVAIRSVVNAETFKFPAITDTAATRRMRRVAEGADLPIVELGVSFSTGYVHKFGVALKITDEAARRVPIDWFRFHLALMGQQNALDKEQVAGEAIQTNATSLAITHASLGGSTSSITTTPIDNLMGLMEEDGFPPTLCVGPRATTTKLKNATTGSGNYPAFRGGDRVLGGGAAPEELTHPPIYSRTWVTASYLLYIDGSAALGEATEAGSEKRETDRDIIAGKNIVAISEVVGYYWIGNTGAARDIDTSS